MKLLTRLDKDVLTALENAKANIESYHKQQLEGGFEDQPFKGCFADS